MNFKQAEIEDMRLAVLRILKQSSGYDANSSVISDGLNMLGHRPSRDKLHIQLAWLAENDLVTTEQVFSVQVAKLTQRGLDVADNKVSVPGVKRPSPQ